MRKFFQTVVILGIIAIGGTALYVSMTDKHVIIFNDGTIKAVDDSKVTYLYDGTILYGDEIFEKEDIASYEKRNVKHLFLNAANSAAAKWEGLSYNTKIFLKKNNISTNLIIAVPSVILVLVSFLLIWSRTLRSTQKKTPYPAADDRKLESSETNDELPTRLDIVRFFLNLFKHQIGADPDAAIEFVPLKSKTADPNHIYELRVKHMDDWTKRRMTIGPLGEDAASKSKCYSVIYDVHMVVKIPARPVTEFEKYIASIKKEVAIVNKLIPKECIVPKVSVILGRLHTFPHSEDTPADRLEEKYIDWVRRSAEYQEYLKINNTFVYFMDLSKYYFLGHILNELHDMKDLIAREIFENAEVIFEPLKFKGRYGVENDAIFEVREIYNRVEADIRQLVDKNKLNANIPIYQFQSWFYSLLAEKEVTSDGGKYPETFINQLNILLNRTRQDNSAVIEVYCKTIKNYVYMSSFEQNSAQVSAISVNLLDILAWLGQKRVSMRDLKPDNLFVAGDPARYPLFLRSAQEFALGIIDVETAVDFEKSEYSKTNQPLLGGTPFYATPSHFIRNEVLSIKFNHLGKILHLQDWYANIVMIYKVITGELLFDQTAKLFGELRSMMISANKVKNYQRNLFEEASRVFWHSAVNEFQVKMDEKEKSLKAIALVLPETVNYMFGKVLAKERKSLALAIKESVESQTIFEQEPIRRHLMKSSYAKTCRFMANLENKIRRSQDSDVPRAEAITFLRHLAGLKALFGQHVYMQKLISHPEPKISAFDILNFMFHVVLNNMYPPQWKPLFDESAEADEMSEEKTSLAATA